MAIEYTPEQKKAIETLDRSVLVSAAAGSGKTAILVERILRIILDGRSNVDELLIVTFTRAAAAEMKVRLAASIRKRMREQPEDAGRLKDQLARLYRAYITTIDSFAMRVIREFFYETDSDPDFRACDEIQAELMKREALSELFEAGFEDDGFLGESAAETCAGDGALEAIRSVGFREFLRLYSEERQEDSFKDKILKSYDGIRSIPDYFAWAYDKAELLRVTEDTFEGSGLQQAMAEDAYETFSRACDASDRLRTLMEDAGLIDFFDEKLGAETLAIHEIRDSALNGGLGEDLLNKANSITFPALRARKEHKESYEPVKEEVKALRDAYKDEIKGWNQKYMTPDFASRLTEQSATYKYTVYYIRLLEEFERRYMEKKNERHVLDFSDMEHIAVRILRKDEPSKIMRSRFRYIFVDEYQDTNRIQEELISSVARPDNVFRVGDVKQSIYKFRQAEPEIFQEVYRKFSDPASEEGTAIDLSMNFRSNKATIGYINRVFGEIMEGYDERARLNPGTSCDPEYDFIPEIHILTTDTEDDAEGETAADEAVKQQEGAASEAQTAQDDSIALLSGDADEEILELSKEEAEADYIAGIAADLIGTEFYDTKARMVRKAEAKDIVILFRAVKARGDIMSAALRRRGIDPHVEESDDYFDTVEIGVAMSLLSCIDNMKRDVPLIASLHSEVFGWTPTELAEIRIAHIEHQNRQRIAEKEAAAAAGLDANSALSDGNEIKKPLGRAAYWEALRWYRESGSEGDLKDKAIYATDKILEWRRMSHMMPLGDFVWHVLVDSGYYRMAGAMHGGSRRQANLRTLADRAARYSRETVASLSTYISFVDVMKKKKISSGQPPAATGDEVVRISTIHKSKGLEYPFVIVGGLGHKFRRDTNSKSFSFDSTIGVGLPYIDPARKYWRSTLVQRAINAKTLRDEYSEELRVLYVAMTRARNKLVLVGTYSSTEALEKYTARPECYLRVMQNVLKTGFNRYRVAPLELRTGKDQESGLSIPDPDKIVLSEDELKIYEEIDRRFSYEYPDRELLTEKAKYSVSEIRRITLDAEDEIIVAGIEAAGNGAAGYDDISEEIPAGAHSQAKGKGMSVKRAGMRRKSKRTSATAADIGTGYHRIMEFIDFARAAAEDGTIDREYIDERAAFLHQKGAISDDVFEEIDTEKIAGFFRSDIGRRASDAARRGVLLKEKAFTLKTRGPVRVSAPSSGDSDREASSADSNSEASSGDSNSEASSGDSNSEASSHITGRSVLVQGVIDCCFEEDGSMILIDYKTSFIRPGASYEKELERIRDEYRVQIELYSEAVLKGTGKPVSEAYLYLFSTGQAISMRV